MERNEFDDIIKQKIDHPIELEDKRAWDLFMLSAIEKGHEEIFEDLTADQMAQGALKNYTVDFDPASWDLLAKMMEEQPVFDTASIDARFDKEVSHSLSGLKRKYDSTSWPRLAARLEVEERYLRHYYKAKFVEAILFIFLVLTLFQFGQTEKTRLDFKQKEIIHKSIHEPTDIPVATDSQRSQHEIKSGQASVNMNTPSFENKKYSDFASLGNTKSFNHPINSKPANVQIDNFQPEEEIIYGHEPIVNLHRGLFSFASLPSRPIDRSQKLIINPEANSKLRKPLLNIDGIDSKLDEVNDLTTLLLPVIRKAALPGSWKIGVYAHMDVNAITLPDQKINVYGKTTSYYAQTLKAFGYGTGFKALYVKNKFGFETGLGYSNKKYTPNRTITGDEFFNIKFKKMEYQILEIPMNIRYGSNKNNRFKTYAQVGLNTNFITKALHDFYVEPKFVQSKSIQNTNTFAQEATLSSTKLQFTKLDKRRVLLYAQGTVGAEWRASTNLDLYTQVSYGQRLLNKELGPIYDQVRSLSMEIGFRTRL